MTPWTSLSGWQAPGRPCKTSSREDTSLFIYTNLQEVHKMQQLRLKNCRMCSSTRTLFKLCLVMLVAVSSVTSAPLSNSAHRHGTPIFREVVESLSSSSSTVEHLSNNRHLSSISASVEEEERPQLREKRALRRNTAWPNATIPFTFDTTTLSLVQRNRLIKAMKVWQKKTCIRFVERTREPYFVNIYRDDAACKTEVGFRKLKFWKDRGQPMQLSQTYCLQSKHRGKIVHELGHALGFYHEHQRPDRDEFVEVIWDKIIDSEYIRKDYEIVENAHSVGTKYDYKSIMHYAPDDNSIDGNDTMIIKDERFVDIVGRRNLPTASDYKQANLFYYCTTDGSDGDIEHSLDRPNLLPTSANDIRSGDSISLTPEVDSNRTWWLNCTDECELSDSAGRKFKGDDMTNCSELIFEMQKVEGTSETLYIQVGDTVALKQRSSQGINLISCSYLDKQCRARRDCVAGNKFDENLMCPEDVFVVGAVGKSSGEQIRHRDSITFRAPHTPPSEEGEINESLFRCKINEDDTNGECYRLDCAYNTLGEAYTSSECNQPSAFLVTKL